MTRNRSDRTPGGTRAARCALAHLAALAAALLLCGPVAQAPAAPVSCSAGQGQAFIDQGRYGQAIREFTCVIDAAPTEVEGYRGRAEAELLLGRYSDALKEYARITALVVPVHPDAVATILAGYDQRLATAPNDIRALTGASFAHWASFDYAQALHLLNHLLEVAPDDPYGNLFRGSGRLLRGATRERGIADLERGIALDPQNPHVRFIVADAYTYGLPDPERALAEASLALDGGLDTPRVHAILAVAYDALGDRAAAASEIQRSIELVTTVLVTASPLAPGASSSLDLVPGRTYEIPLAAVAGETISIATSSKDFYDSIAVLLAPDGTPVVGSDDENGYFAAFAYTAQETGTYRLQVTSFEGIDTGELVVKRG
jgi:tetratricopeptide (TPR) repeat protein